MKLLASILFFVSAQLCFAQQPLVSDNALPLGKGVFQLEFAHEFQNEYCYGIHDKVMGEYVTFSYGFTERFEILVTQGFENIFSKNLTENTHQYGYTDLMCETKWHFFSTEKVSFNFKPGILIASGDYENGLSTGKTGFKSGLLTSIKFNNCFWNIDVAYIMNENTNNELRNLWHFSSSIDYTLNQKLHGVIDLGSERKTEVQEINHPMFGLIGMYYAPNDHTELSLGYKHGLTEPETDNSLIIGFTKRF